MIVYQLKRKTKMKMIVLQSQNCCYFDICLKHENWKRIRSIWIVFYQNNDNQSCFWTKLPKDIVLKMVDILDAIRCPTICVHNLQGLE